VKIDDKYVALLKKQGYAVVPGLLTQKELVGARKAMGKYFPTPQELEDSPDRYRALIDQADFLQREFPYTQDELCDIALHPDIISFVERALGTTDVMLARSAIWAKYAGFGDYGQSHHCDYEGNTLAYPREDGDYRMVNMIIYLTDVTKGLGPTYVVSQEKTRGMSLWPAFRSREDYPDFYKWEKPVLAKAGSVFVFGMQTFHRASTVTDLGGTRQTLHLVYKGGRHRFSGYQTWSSFGEQYELQRVLIRATPRQREVLGFPAVGDPYWTPATLKGTQERYPEMDLYPYEKGMKETP
jgi:hypothetical protein